MTRGPRETNLVGAVESGESAKMSWSCWWLVDYELMISPFRACPQPSILDFERSGKVMGRAWDAEPGLSFEAGG
jgi:hypothetical protein